MTLPAESGHRPLFWVDAQLPPAMAVWIQSWGHAAVHVEQLGLLAATDHQIFEAARAADAVIITKDYDFAAILHRLGPPPRVVLLAVGNCRNSEARVALEGRWTRLVAAISAGECLIEVGRK